MTDVGQERRRISDPKVLRALAHPARVAIIEDLNVTGEGRTATELAEIVGLSPSATSYHLRELAKVGMIEQAPSRGDGRERVWQSPVHSWGIDLERDADADTQAAEDELVGMYVDRDYARLRAFLARARGEQPEWHDAAGYNTSTVIVTAEELKELFEQVQRLIAPLRVRDRKDAVPEGARTARVHFAVFPDD
ncbi:winged helix-turn-helix domain-containing protein [Asanoa sp. WMMD1127]|uniref:ArsR/SmtB family transcription factor n=1 Tax=Asanoa sp. WMMD1127 TaxID=3016107 RepID=UPI0024179A2A|nr:winged helix-turn-helix domain-containing protein [Asanoa sp. WMMD1127]MDG4821632.1 winged helix-turn-helix domain-containing protein [Asanoa sp. WMMD1127]